MDRAQLADFLRARREALQPGLDRYIVYRWFTDPKSRLIYPVEDHPKHGRVFTSQLREVYAAAPNGRAKEIVDALLDTSEEFRQIWAEHHVGVTHTDRKRLVHSQLGELDLYCQTLNDPDQSQTLLVFTAVPGSPSYEKLQLLAAVGN